MNGGRPRILIPGPVALLLVGGLVWVTQAPRGEPTKARDQNQQLLNQIQNQAVPVTVIAVQPRAIQQTLTLTGTIQTPSTSNVSAPVPGQVQAVYVSEGDRVAAGQALAQLNPEQAQTQVAQAQQQVNAALSSFQKAVAGKALVARQAAGDVETARLGLREAQIGLRKARAGAPAPAIDQAAAQALQAHAGAREANDALRSTQFLYDHGVVPLSTLQDVRTKAVQAQAGADAADAAVRQAKAGATVEDRQLAAAKVDEARQGYEQAVRSQGDRIAVAAADAEAAKTQYQSAREQLRLAQLQQQYARITSPIDGLVAAVRIHSGEAAMPGMPLFVITSLGNVFFDSLSSEAERLQLAPGQPATVTLQALPGKAYSGKVVSVGAVENPGTAGFEVRISLPASGGQIPPGAYASAAVETGYSSSALVIPIEAVLTADDGSKYVYVIRRPGTAVRQPITLGITTTNQAAVTSGLKAGDQVVVQGGELLHGSSASVAVQGAAS